MPTSGAMYAVQFVDCMLKLQIKKTARESEWRAPVGVVGVGSTYYEGTVLIRW